MTGTNAAATAKQGEPTQTATPGWTSVTPDLIQQFLDHDYLKLKIQAQVDELTNARLTRWRNALLAAASAAVVILGYLGIQANQIANDFNQRAEKVQLLQNQIVAAQTKVDSASARVDDLVSDANGNAERSRELVSSSLDFLRANTAQLNDNVRQLNKLNETTDNVTQRLKNSEDQLKNSETQLEDELKIQKNSLKQTLERANPVIEAADAASNAAEEARRAGTVEIVFLESNSNRAVDLSDYLHPETKYHLKFSTNRIKARASVDVETTVNNQTFPVQHLANLSVPEVKAIEHTSLKIEVSALRHHRQPFLHSFLILRVFSEKPDQPLVTASVGQR